MKVYVVIRHNTAGDENDEHTVTVLSVWTDKQDAEDDAQKYRNDPGYPPDDVEVQEKDLDESYDVHGP